MKAYTEKVKKAILLCIIAPINTCRKGEIVIFTKYFDKILRLK